MKATTIDNLDMRIHERYAQDQQALDKTFITEAQLLSPSFEKVATSFRFTLLNGKSCLRWV